MKLNAVEYNELRKSAKQPPFFRSSVCLNMLKFSARHWLRRICKGDPFVPRREESLIA